jgi:hypothetical protein
MKYDTLVLRFSPRAAWLLLLGLPLSSCDGSLQLVVVDQGGSSNSSLAGTSETGGSVSVIPVGGTVGEAGRTEPAQGGSAGKPDVIAGGAGAPDVPLWDLPARYTASFVPYGYPDQFVRYVEDKGFIAVIDVASELDRQDASFEMSPGLWDLDCVSFRAVNRTGAFFRHSGSRIFMHPATDTPLFQTDATFCEDPGFADPEGVTFRSINYPQRVIHLRNVNELWIDDIPDPMTPEFAADCTFYRQPALVDVTTP